MDAMITARCRRAADGDDVDAGGVGFGALLPEDAVLPLVGLPGAADELDVPTVV